MGVKAELAQARSERDGFERVAAEAMRLLDEHGLLPELRDRMDELDCQAALSMKS